MITYDPRHRFACIQWQQQGVTKFDLSAAVGAMPLCAPASVQQEGCRRCVHHQLHVHNVSKGWTLCRFPESTMPSKVVQRIIKDARTLDATPRCAWGADESFATLPVSLPHMPTPQLRVNRVLTSIPGLQAEPGLLRHNLDGAGGSTLHPLELVLVLRCARKERVFTECPWCKMRSATS